MAQGRVCVGVCVCVCLYVGLLVSYGGSLTSRRHIPIQKRLVRVLSKQTLFLVRVLPVVSHYICEGYSLSGVDQLCSLSWFSVSPSDV